jgi:hypothetical protein
MRDRASSRIGTTRLDVVTDVVMLGGRSLGFLVIIAGLVVGLRLLAGAL